MIWRLLREIFQGRIKKMSDTQISNHMTSKDAAAYLRISVETLYRWRAKKCAPTCRRINGGHPIYFREDLDAFIRQMSVVEKPRKLKRSG